MQSLTLSLSHLSLITLIDDPFCSTTSHTNPSLPADHRKIIMAGSFSMTLFLGLSGGTDGIRDDTLITYSSTVGSGYRKLISRRIK